ncbi:thymidylate synthase [Conidiobolus coronatus NRRL 28638]|uniref:thymidylate synthase n=1 Tax=Conidiobolus coronatus (strain ATCC 28846 / CBS 209.66 / NRRL 28638) TaxID=796925 RepID=A0A137PGD2_CONC2|nr:thymidylate synthase [Conidiobolus coronatus NRRL 28638]|eukprot:KXN74035.1 thymidylate synthase [Conidiobolus coronatus NRRL 28638]
MTSGKENNAHPEYQYLNLIRHIIDNGEFRADRTGTGTLAVFAPPSLRFNLKDSFPLLTTKRVFFRGVAEELLWFVNGKTDAKLLQDKNIHIWDGNGSREYLDSIGLKDRREGDLGPVYGWQWRHFGAEYKDCDTDYTGQGVDQLMEVIDKVKNKPYDRRIVMSAWNPADLGKMALPPCHMFCQFYVSTPTPENPVPRLSCQMYQRSCDMGLGVPFNIASYSLLTLMIAHVCKIEPGEFILTMGDCHVYKDHVEALETQLQRTPNDFPTLKFKREITNIEDFVYEDFILENYNPQKKIEMTMSV